MMDRQRLNPGRKFDQVRDGARDIFLRDGYSGASVDDIARAAGVSKATLYSYFPEKRMMYREVLLDEMKRIAAESPISICPDLAPAEALPLMARQIAEWLASDPVVRMSRTTIAEAVRFPEVSRQYHAICQSLLRDVVQAHLERWVAAGDLQIEDTRLAAEQFVRLSGTLLQESSLLLANPAPRDSVIREVSDSAARLFLAAHGDGTAGRHFAAVS
ncbi:TetR/AcrR family transcriptional regulator [Paracoccus spongiarum]|uniref:TetR/AcrR family transcriptional regulator n=1 Tax=Paracoccus spongiarum TaxID=3064387 RepID=A0ABT9JDJ6_9RHOB|nr:TetR/AcrR family transcriptional regulator [Paracoccus sp. 2205BS29-5]MDP5307156.1 TetR/AcrR family transcriptional regulator [Paracoccus sp. 2205BS29-5]